MKTSKIVFDVNIYFEVEEDKIEETLEKVMKIICEHFKCGATRIESYDGKIYVEAEFCNPLEKVDG